MSSLAGKVVLVTGGGQGLGAAICRTLGEAGATVVVADLRRAAAQETARRLGDRQCQARVVEADVGDEADARRAVRETVEACGRIDVLVNNAGTDVTKPMAELQFAEWDRVVRTNLYGPFLLSKYAAREMERNGGGHIINIASTAAKRAWPNAAAYHASKWGLLGLSHALHAELRSRGIRVTAVIAGGMRTPFLLERFPDLDPGVLQDPDNVARTVHFVLTLPDESVIPEVMVLPLRETSWP